MPKHISLVDIGKSVTTFFLIASSPLYIKIRDVIVFPNLGYIYPKLNPIGHKLDKYETLID